MGQVLVLELMSPAFIYFNKDMLLACLPVYTIKRLKIIHFLLLRVG